MQMQKRKTVKAAKTVSRGRKAVATPNILKQRKAILSTIGQADKLLRKAVELTADLG